MIGASSWLEMACLQSYANLPVCQVNVHKKQGANPVGYKKYHSGEGTRGVVMEVLPRCGM